MPNYHHAQPCFILDCVKAVEVKDNWSTIVKEQDYYARCPTPIPSSLSSVVRQTSKIAINGFIYWTKTRLCVWQGFCSELKEQVRFKSHPHFLPVMSTERTSKKRKTGSVCSGISFHQPSSSASPTPQILLCPGGYPNDIQLSSGPLLYLKSVGNSVLDTRSRRSFYVLRKFA